MQRSSKHQDLVKNLKCGKVCVFETDTVVGIACSIENLDALSRIYKIKQRDTDKALPWLISSKNMLKKYVNSVSNKVLGHIEKDWPGNTTIILEVNDKVNAKLGNITKDGKHTVGFRIPKCHDLVDAIKELGCPIACTSANISGKAPVNKIEELDNGLANNVDFVYLKDLYTGDYTLPSKVISIIDDDEDILRV